ncbi:MAG TPA: DUF6442 family protein [Desulfosporosinus sp.]|nr:DUF6442 family protein [Desulfosporosinus sp.]
MNKEEILTKSRNEGSDERVRSIMLASFGIGNIITLILCMIFVGINGIRGESYMEFVTIAFGSVSATHFSQYKKLNDKKGLLLSIFEGVLAIAAFILFIVKG